MLRQFWVGFCFFILLLSFISCDDSRESKGLYDVDSENQDMDEKEILKHIDMLGGSKGIDDPDAAKEYSDAKEYLTMRGQSIEPYMIEALAGSSDWGIRLGAIHVLDSIATKNAVEPLIRALQDTHPQVALKAMYSLRGLTGERFIAEEEGAAGLPVIPQRATDDYRLNAENIIWEKWWTTHGADLQLAWQEWWDANKTLVVIE